MSQPASAGSIGDSVITPGVGPVSVAVVMPLTVPPTQTGLLDADALTTYTDDDGLLTAQLDSVIGTSVAIGLDPMVFASIRVLGTAAPDTAVAFLERLRTASNDVFMLGYADADPVLTAQASGGVGLDPLGFDFAIDPANFGPADPVGPSATPDSSPTPTVEPDDEPPPLPSTEDVLAWPTTLDSIAWPTEGGVDSDGLASLAAMDYTNVLLSGSNVSETATALVDLGEIDGIVADVAVSSAVRDASNATSSAAFQEAAGRLATALQDHAAATPGRTIVATLDRRLPFGTLRLGEVLSTIDAASSSQLVTLSEVLTGPRGGAQLVEPAADLLDDRIAVMTALVQASADEASFLSIAESASVITQPRRLELLGLAASAWHSNERGWMGATDDVLAESLATLDAVQITEGSDLLLLSDISTLRMEVSNALPVAVTVYLSVRPLRPLLHVEDSAVEVTIEPDSTSTASIPVESITNGDVTVRAELRSASGRTLGDERFVKVILQAGWETAGTLIAGSLVVLVFGVGLVRIILRRRREAAAGAGAAGSAMAADD